MEEQLSHLETEMGLLKEQVKLLLDQNSKPQTVMKFKPKIGHPKRKCGRSVMIYRRPPAPVDILPPEMLQMIIKKLDTRSMKNSRLVCRFWNINATPVLANRTEINLCEFFPRDDDNNKFMLTFPRKITPCLVKKIKAIEGGEEVVKLLIAFCEKYGKEVQGLKFRGWFLKNNKRLLYLYGILTELCPKLQDLCVDDMLYDNEIGNLTKEQMSFEFSKPLALKFIRLRNVFRDGSYVMPPLSNFLNNVILASRQLETLEVDLKYCPKDLSNQTAVKTLYFKQVSFSDIKDIKLPYQNCIENVTVDVPPQINPRPDSKDKTNGNDQRFPALRNLKIESKYDGKLESNFAYYMLERSPALESISIAIDEVVENSRKFKILRDLFHTKPAGRAFARLSTLKFVDIRFEDHELFKFIVNLTNFPNLATLEFSIGKYASLQNYQRDLKISEWFETLSKLKLVHLAVNMRCKIIMSNITSGFLENPSLFRGLETLKITHENGGFGADDLHDSPEQMADFQKALLMTSTLKQAQFTGFLMWGSTFRSLMDFVTKNHLPVQIY